MTHLKNMIQVSMLTIKSTQWAALPTSSLWQKRQQDHTPWPDGITAKSLHKVDSFHVLFNTFLVTEYTPRWLRKGVVMLVPKIANPSRPSDYRPTTVCPQLLRCYHGIALLRKQLHFINYDDIGLNKTTQVLVEQLGNQSCALISFLKL